MTDAKVMAYHVAKINGEIKIKQVHEYSSFDRAYSIIKTMAAAEELYHDMKIEKDGPQYFFTRRGITYMIYVGRIDRDETKRMINLYNKHISKQQAA